MAVFRTTSTFVTRAARLSRRRTSSLVESCTRSGKERTREASTTRKTTSRSMFFSDCSFLRGQKRVIEFHDNDDTTVDKKTGKRM